MHILLACRKRMQSSKNNVNTHALRKSDTLLKLNFAFLLWKGQSSLDPGNFLAWKKELSYSQHLQLPAIESRFGYDYEDRQSCKCEMSQKNHPMFIWQRTDNSICYTVRLRRTIVEINRRLRWIRHLSCPCFLFLVRRSREGAGGPDSPLKNHKNIGFLSTTGPDPLKITKPLSQHPCWAITRTPAKRHLNGVSLAGRLWPAYSGIWVLFLLIDKNSKWKTTRKKFTLLKLTPYDKTELWQNFQDPCMSYQQCRPGVIRVISPFDSNVFHSQSWQAPAPINTSNSHIICYIPIAELVYT